MLRTFFVTRDGYGELLDGPKKILVESDESHLWLMVPEIPTIEDPMGTRVLWNIIQMLTLMTNLAQVGIYIFG